MEVDQNLSISNVLRVFKNDPPTVADAREVTVIASVWNWKMHEQFAKNNRDYDKPNP